MASKQTIYDAEKLAKFFGVTSETVQDWCRKGKLPAFKIGKEWKVRAVDLEKMISERVHSRGKKKERTGIKQKLF